MGTSRNVLLGFSVLASIGLFSFASAEQQDERRARADFESLSQEQNKSNISVNSSTRVTKEISPEDKRAISQAASRLLVHVDQAREAITNNNSAKAVENVEKAQTLAQIIENNSPIYHVKTEIRSGSLNYSDEAEVKPMVVPVYSELERVDVIAPLKAARQQNGQAASLVKVADTDAQVTTVNLNVRVAKAALTGAKQALNNDKMELADRHLREMQSGVSLTYSAVDMPLVSARENLALARIYAQENKVQPAQELLKAAANSLEAYEKNAGSSRSQDVANLRKDIESAQRNTNIKSEDLSSRLTQWWEKVANWMS